MSLTIWESLYPYIREVKMLTFLEVNFELIKNWPSVHINNKKNIPGCFLISTADTCFDAANGLTYCWCSSKDLCKTGVHLISNNMVFMVVISLWMLQ